MKKTILFILSFMLIFSALTCSAFGATDVKVNIDGKYLTASDAKAFVDQNNRTLVPMRALGESLGCTVNYYKENGKAYIELSKKTPNGILIKSLFTVNSKNYYVQVSKIVDFGGTSTMDTAPVILNNRTYLPARYVAEQFGYTVQWNSSTSTVTVKKNQESVYNQQTLGTSDTKYTGTWSATSYVYQGQTLPADNVGKSTLIINSNGLIKTYFINTEGYGYWRTTPNGIHISSDVEIPCTYDGKNLKFTFNGITFNFVKK